LSRGGVRFRHDRITHKTHTREEREDKHRRSSGDGERRAGKVKGRRKRGVGAQSRREQTLDKGGWDTHTHTHTNTPHIHARKQAHTHSTYTPENDEVMRRVRNPPWIGTT
jgi:hypothetical protein